jgi:hypothetical protein
LTSYQLLKEYKGLEPFAVFHPIMWTKTDDDLCIGDHERRIRELLMWLNDRNAPYQIIIKEELKPVENFDGYNGYQSYRHYHNNYELVVEDDDAVVLMKLFFEDFVPFPITPEPVVVVETSTPITEPPPENFFAFWLKRLGFG